MTNLSEIAEFVDDSACAVSLLLSSNGACHILLSVHSELGLAS